MLDAMSACTDKKKHFHFMKCLQLIDVRMQDIQEISEENLSRSEKKRKPIIHEMQCRVSNESRRCWMKSEDKCVQM